jgi:3-oxoacyl-[acyl-carrier-protein] synthase III
MVPDTLSPMIEGATARPFVAANRGLSRAVLNSTGSCVPRRVLRNDDFHPSLQTNDEWIRTRTGIRERRIAGPEENSSSLGLEASRQALIRSGLTGRDLDLIVVATVTPLTMVPSNACRLQAGLGCRPIGAFDINGACTGFVQALAVANQFIASGSCRHVLVVGAEVLSRTTDYSDRNTCILFGDGAGAVILSAGPGTSNGSSSGVGLRWVRLFSDGSRGDLIQMSSQVTYRCLPLDGGLGELGKPPFLRLNGREVFKFAVRALIDLVREALASTSLTEQNRLFLVPHQVNQRIIDAALPHLDIPPERVILNLDRHGNTSSASIPIALDEALRNGTLVSGDHIVLAAFGGGLTWGGALLSL